MHSDNFRKSLNIPTKTMAFAQLEKELKEYNPEKKVISFFATFKKKKKDLK